jgi:AcrR family transcriptional regulator
MPRPTRQELDDEIVDRAAQLFARHGFRETSVQRIADAVGYSKTGLLHRYPSKEALQDEVLRRSVAEMRAVGAAVAGRAPGPDRDHAAIAALAGLAARRPGFIALLLSSVSAIDTEPVPPHLETIGKVLFEAFAVDPIADPARGVRVIGALGALAVASIACHKLSGSDPRTLLINVSYDALGHPR